MPRLALLTAALVFAAACGAEATPTAAPTPTPSPTAAPAPATATPTPAPPTATPRPAAATPAPPARTPTPTSAPPSPTPTPVPPPTATPEPPGEPEALCFSTQAYPADYIMAVIGQDSIPAAFDAMNGGGCDFPIAVHAVRIELTGENGAQTADVKLPEPSRSLGVPFDDLDVPLIDADLPDGRYARRVAALAWVGNDETEIEIPGFEDVHLVRDPESQQAQLFLHRGRWERMHVMDYDYTGAWVCFCPQEMIATAAVSVRGGAVTSVTSAEPGVGVIPVPERFVPIAGLFELLQDAVDQGAHEIDANYDEQYAYPTGFFINYDDAIADEERGFIVRSFTPR